MEHGKLLVLLQPADFVKNRHALTPQAAPAAPSAPPAKAA